MRAGRILFWLAIIAGGTHFLFFWRLDEKIQAFWGAAGAVTYWICKSYGQRLTQWQPFSRLATHGTSSHRQFIRWVPSPKLRKLLTKLLADQEPLITELVAEERLWQARWIWAATWALFLWYALRAPLVSAVRMFSR